MATEPRHRLGRGLASLLGEAKLPAGEGGIGDVGVGQLEPNPYQPRAAFEPSDLDELAASIRTNGLLQPILARPHPEDEARFQIIAGERRWRAAQLAGLERIPCLIRPLTDGEAAAAAMVENLQRKNLNAIEEAEGFHKLMNGFGMTHEDLATAIGKSRSYVANALRLLKLPEDVVQHVRTGVLTAGHARAALAYADPSAAAQMMVVEGLNVRQAERLETTTTRQRPPQPGRGRKGADPDLAALEADLGEKLGLRVEISSNGSHGAMKLYFQTLDQLDYLIAKLGSEPG